MSGGSGPTTSAGSISGERRGSHPQSHAPPGAEPERLERAEVRSTSSFQPGSRPVSITLLFSPRETDRRSLRRGSATPQPSRASPPERPVPSRQRSSSAPVGRARSPRVGLPSATCRQGQEATRSIGLPPRSSSAPCLARRRVHPSHRTTAQAGSRTHASARSRDASGSGLARTVDRRTGMPQAHLSDRGQGPRDSLAAR